MTPTVPRFRSALRSCLVSLACFAMAVFWLLLSQAQAQQPAPAKKKTIAVLAAVGDQMQIVRRRLSVGSNLEPFVRQWVTVPDQALNKMVLRGMDRAITAEYPDAEVVYLMLTPDPKDRELRADQREEATYRRAMELLAAQPQRMQWDEIMLVSPKWLFPEQSGMASKLVGIGIFVQPLESARGRSFGVDDILDQDFLDPEGEQVRDLGKHKQFRSQTYIAPYFFMKITVLDAKTLKVLRTDERFDFRRLINSDSAAINVMNSIPPDVLAEQMAQFVEASARRLVVDRPGSIDIGPLRTTPAAPAKQ